MSHKLRRIYYREILYLEWYNASVTIIGHTHVYVCTCIHKLLPIRWSPREREAAGSRNVVVATLSRKGKNEEEEMICTGRAAYTETKAYVCVCVFKR